MRIILGGPQVTYSSPEELVHFYPRSLVDIFIQGFGEDAMHDLHVDPDQFFSNTLRLNNQVIFKQQQEHAFDSLVSPYLSRVAPLQRFVRWEFQRGCQFSCSFCQHPQSDHKTKTIQRDRVFGEIDLFCDTLGEDEKSRIVQDIAVVDPTFNSGKNYIEILKRFNQKLSESSSQTRMKLSLQCRLEMIKPEFLDCVQELKKIKSLMKKCWKGDARPTMCWHS